MKGHTSFSVNFAATTSVDNDTLLTDHFDGLLACVQIIYRFKVKQRYLQEDYTISYLLNSDDISNTNE